jgi:glycosyltransferase involved in cell wall biosynthesis
VTFIDHTTDVAPYLRASDVFVLPSAREGLPNALLEAMACGVPPIVTHIPGVTDFVVGSGVNGLAVDRAAAPLATALESLVNDAAYRAELGARARGTIDERFAIEGVADRYAALYHALVAAA